MQGEECGCCLHSTLFLRGDLIYQVLKGLQIDSTHCNPGGRYLQEFPQESLPRRAEVHNDDRVNLHSSICLISPATSSVGSVSFCTPSSVAPSRNSRMTSPLSVTSITHSSVIMVSTTLT